MRRENTYTLDTGAEQYPLLSVDTVIFTVREDQLQVLLVKRAVIPGKEISYPCQGQWALVGGLVDIAKDLDLEASALRRLQEKTKVASPYLEQLRSWGSAKRDPRKWAATVVYFALIPSEGVELVAGARVDAVQWWPVDEAMKLDLAFDHREILTTALERLRSKVEYTSLPVSLLPEVFTLPELQKTYEIVLGRPVDKSSFRKRMLDADFLEELRETRPTGKKPAQLYRRKDGIDHVLFPRTFYR